MGRPAQIDRTLILRASLDLADERGLAGVTMQAVADRLGLTPMAPTGTSPTRPICSTRSRRACWTEFSLPDPRLPWRERFAALARAARASAKRHPDVFPLLLQRAVSTPGGQRVRDAVCTALRTRACRTTRWRAASGS